MRNTPERVAILHAVQSGPKGLTPTAVLAKLEQNGYHVSAATVYAALRVLCEASVAKRAISPDGKVVFLPMVDERPQARLVCRACGKVRSANIPDLARMLISRPYWGFAASSVTVRIEGLCAKCRKAIEAADKRARAESSAHEHRHDMHGPAN